MLKTDHIVETFADLSEAEREVPKRDLVSNLAIIFQDARLKSPRGLAEAPAMIEELQNFRLSGSRRKLSWSCPAPFQHPVEGLEVHHHERAGARVVFIEDQGEVLAFG